MIERNTSVGISSVGGSSELIQFFKYGDIQSTSPILFYSW